MFRTKTQEKKEIPGDIVLLLSVMLGYLRYLSHELIFISNLMVVILRKLTTARIPKIIPEKQD